MNGSKIKLDFRNANVDSVIEMVDLLRKLRAG